MYRQKKRRQIDKSEQKHGCIFQYFAFHLPLLLPILSLFPFPLVLYGVIQGVPLLPSLLPWKLERTEDCSVSTVMVKYGMV